MATRTAQVIIQVDDKSLVELNAEIKTLETSIKNLKIGTTEWIAQNQKLGTLKTRFKEATDEAKKLQGQIQKISGADQLRSIAKLGAGMVGAFAAVSGTLSALGIKGGKTMEEITAKGVELMQIFGGLNQLAETFSSTNLKGLKGIGAGFKGLVASVRGASLAMKAALISTGIGALVVAVGLLVANWDKIKNLFSGQKRNAEEAYKMAQAQTKLSESNYQAAQKAVELQKLQNNSKEYALNLAQAEVDASDLYHDSLMAQTKELVAYYNTLKTGAGEAAKMTVEERKAAMELTQSKQDMLAIELNISHILGARANANLINEKAITKLNEEIRKQSNYLTEINTKLYNSEESYKSQLTILQDQKKLIEETATKINRYSNEYTKDQQDQLDALDAQILALNEQEKLRKEALKDELLQLNYEKTFKDLIDNINASYQIQSDILAEEVNQYQQISTYFDKQINGVTDLNKKYEEMVKKREALINFDKKGAEIYLKQHEQLREQLKGYDDIYEQTRDKLKLDLEGEKINEKVLNMNARQLSLYKLVNNAKIEKLNYENQGFELELKTIELQKQQIVSEDKILSQQITYLNGLLKEAQLKLEAAKSEEERKAMLEKVYDLESKIADLNKTVADNKTKTIALDGQIVAVENDILKTTTEIDATTADTLDKEKDVTAEIKKQSRAYKILQGFVEKYSEEIQAVTDLLLQSMELVSTIFDSNATRHQDEIDRLMVQYDEMNNAEADRQDRLLAYEEELKDANGDRYDELLRLIDEEKAAKDANFVSEVDQKNKLASLEHQKLLDERQAALWRKRQAIIEALIQGALAVVKALPNVFLSVAVGVLSAAGVATIAAQKVPDVPPQEKFEKGGFTRKGKNKDVAGIVHANEYVIPADVVGSSKAQHHIAALERQRVRGYAEGGFVAPANSSSSPGFEYEKLSKALINAIKEMPNPQVGLVNISNGLKEVELTKSQAGLTR